MTDNKKDNVYIIWKILIWIAWFLFLLLISFGIFSGLIYLIFTIFDLTFSFKTCFGLYLILFTIGLFFGGGK